MDIACGQGFILQMLKEADIEGVGIGFDDQLVAEARSAGLNVSQADMFQYLQPTKERFNGGIAWHIVEHFVPPRVLKLLQLINRVILGRSVRLESGITVVSPWLTFRRFRYSKDLISGTL